MRDISYRAAIDIGGTFTDFVLRSSDGQTLTLKVSSTPDDYGRAIVEGLQTLAARFSFAPTQVVEIVHGTTVATNTILEGKGARTALITTSGFRDVLELRRIRIAQLYNMFYDRPAPLVPRRRRFEVVERIDYRGHVETPLEDDAIDAALEQVIACGAQALAICLLHSYANPVHERRIEARASEILPTSTFISASYQVLPEIKEYERTSTTVINAYIGPAIRRYGEGLQQALARAGFDAPIRIMQSSGGVLSLEEVLTKPAYIVESGPAAGVIGAATTGSRWDEPNLLTVDMGGTTAKAALIEGGRVARTSEYEVGAGINISSRLVKGGGHALKLPVIDVSEIGAGGGSIARVSSHGVLSVGPESAGAAPGPACYGAGGSAATLTDAMVTLGYVNPEYLVNGELTLHAQRARDAVTRDVAVRLDLSLLEAAYGIFVLAAATMTRAVKAVSSFRGRDPRDFTLFAFGGNGPLMATEIASALEIGRVLVPRHAGLYSAVGLLGANIEREVSRTVMRSLDGLDSESIEAAFVALEREIYKAHLSTDDVPRLALQRFADLRFHGQAFELTVPAPDEGEVGGALRRAFVDEHRRTYGHGDAEAAIDLVNLRVKGALAAAVMQTTGATLTVEASGPRRMSREVYFGPRWKALPTPILERAALQAARPGPVIIEESDTTILVPPDWRASLAEDACIVLEKRE